MYRFWIYFSGFSRTSIALSTQDGAAGAMGPFATLNRLRRRARLFLGGNFRRPGLG